ncbi:MAG: hypothetical protein VST68_12460 [Nitrospirota bacterium]|nr:hypothetical protein [Nitrospirota bacterium]
MNEHAKRFCYEFVGLMVVCGFFIGCASSSKESTSQPSVEEVREDSDRFFNKMEQEEKVRAYPEP